MTYEEAVNYWAQGKLRLEQIPFDEVTSVQFEVYSRQSCSTCGPWTEYEADVFYTHKGKKSFKSFEFQGLTEIMQELFSMPNQVGEK